MRLDLIFLILFVLTNNTVEAKPIWITTGSDVAQLLTEKDNSLFQNEEAEDVSSLEVDESDLPRISDLVHENFHRCGGYFVHDSFAEMQNFLSKFAVRDQVNLSSYSINRQTLVKAMILQINEQRIRQTIENLSRFQNRYYQSETGLESQTLVKETWEKLAANRSDITVQFIEHSNWKQPSVELTILGSVEPEKMIIIGGHGDSIVKSMRDLKARAPGADDNASGISVLTEVIQVLTQNNYQPKNTIKFYSYAAEEVGLRGSKEIATSAKNNGWSILGVLQLDMTNYQGSDLEIVMMKDFTDSNQNKFLGEILDNYLTGVSWGYDKCGYACSDHASWNALGFPASMPFESRFRDMNRKIHTNGDLIDVSEGHATHATKFAQMTLAYLLELDKTP